MAEVSFQGKTFEVDEDGFLLRFEDWCPEWLEFVKEAEGIPELTDDHHKVVDFLQDYYKKNGIDKEIPGACDGCCSSCCHAHEHGHATEEEA